MIPMPGIMASLLGFHLEEMMEQFMVPLDTLEELKEKFGNQIFLQEPGCHIFLDGPAIAYMQ